MPWRGLRVCPLVCYDLRFPVYSRRRPGLDYDLLIYVANWPAPRADAWRALLPARAIENQAYVVGVNRVGTDGMNMSYAGDSMALDFRGRSLAQAGEVPGVITVELSAGAAAGLPGEVPRAPGRRPLQPGPVRVVLPPMKKTTRVNHPPAVEVPAGQPAARRADLPVGQVRVRHAGGHRAVPARRAPGFFYSRASNPTTRQLEKLLAELQGREDCLVTASGVGAVAQTLLTLTKQGDHVLCFVETYNPSRYLIRRLLRRFGVTHTMLSIEDQAGIERVLAAQPTRLVFFESPTNPVTKIADIAAITRLARAAGALTVLDNTFAGFHQHGEFDIDLFVHSLTKYASGTGDVMGGAVIGRSELIRAMRTDFGVLGGTLDPHAAFLILRGLKTYFVRYQAQCASAARIAQQLAAHPAVARVHYPGLARASAARAGRAADAGLRQHRHPRPQGRRGRGAALCRLAAAVRACRKPGLDRVAGDYRADDGRA